MLFYFLHFTSWTFSLFFDLIYLDSLLDFINAFALFSHGQNHKNIFLSVCDILRGFIFVFFRILESQKSTCNKFLCNKYFARFLPKAFCEGFCGYEVLEVFDCVRFCLFFSFCAKSAQIKRFWHKDFISLFSLCWRIAGTRR